MGSHLARVYVPHQATLSPNIPATPSFFNDPISPNVVPRNAMRWPSIPRKPILVVNPNSPMRPTARKGTHGGELAQYH
jgi:hypothetical protein